MLNERNPVKKRLKIFHWHHILAVALTVLQNITKILHNYFDDVSGYFILQGDCNLTCKFRAWFSQLPHPATSSRTSPRGKKQHGGYSPQR